MTYSSAYLFARQISAGSTPPPMAEEDLYNNGMFNTYYWLDDNFSLGNYLIVTDPYTRPEDKYYYEDCQRIIRFNDNGSGPLRYENGVILYALAANCNIYANTNNVLSIDNLGNGFTEYENCIYIPIKSSSPITDYYYINIEYRIANSSSPSARFHHIDCEFRGVHLEDNDNYMTILNGGMNDSVYTNSFPTEWRTMSGRIYADAIYIKYIMIQTDGKDLVEIKRIYFTHR